MKRFSFFLLLLFFPYFIVQAAPRKKVALVLSGGGAKGAAHVGVLKVVDKMNIPIDYIVGTSIGAIVGGLYATGYSPEQLEDLIKNSNWLELLSDKVPRNQIPFPYKADTEKYLFSLVLGQRNCGILKGNNISNLLENLTSHCRHVENFDSLPVPFACIATDMATNKKEVIRSGSLAKAMRASMAVPIAFEPVFMQDKVLVDGGFKDNLPIDVAKDMGADIIIAIDVQSDLSPSNELKSIGDIANQLMLMICQSNSGWDDDGIDSYMKVNVDGFTAASFTPEAMDALIRRGEETALQHKHELKSILAETGQARPRIQEKRNINTYIPSYTPNIKDKQLRIALRFDSEDIAALMLTYNTPQLKRHGLKFSLRGGKQSFFQADYNFSLDKLQGITLSNKIGYNDYFFYSNGRKIANPTYLQNTTMFSYRIVPQRNLQLEVGISMDYHRYYRTLTSCPSPFNGKEDLFLNYRAQLKYETLDKKYFPTKGVIGGISYTMYDDLRSSKQYSALRATIAKVFSVASNTYFTPALYGRFVFNDNVPFVYQNAMGGEGFNLRNEHQIPFSGFTHIEHLQRFLGSAQMKISHCFKKVHHISLSGNLAFNSNQCSRIFKGKKIYGIGVGYGYESPIGPIEGNIGYSNQTDKIGLHFNIGYVF